MGKLRNSLAFGAVGVAGGVVGMSTVTGLCGGGVCSACFRCSGMGAVIVVLALWKKWKGERTDGLAKSSN